MFDMNLQEIINGLSESKTEDDVITLMNTQHKTANVLGKPAHIQLKNYAIGAIVSYPFPSLVPLFEQYNRLVQVITKPQNAVQVFNRIRNSILEKYGDGDEYKQTKELMKIPKATYDNIRDDYKRETVKKNRARDNISGATIRTIIEKLRLLPVDLYILLQITSGCRIGELQSVSTYKAMPDGVRIEQKNIEKRKVKDAILIKPILFMDSNEWVTLLNIARNANPQPALNSINGRIKSLFKNPDMSSHDLRRMYGSIGYQLLPDSERIKISECAYLGEVLGHDPLDITVSTIYSTMHVDADPLKKFKFSLMKPDIVVPRNGPRGSDVYTCLRATIQALKHNKVKLTQTLISTYGYSPATIRKFLDDNPKFKLS